MKIKDDSIIYIFCPINYGTGGPEALHQLGSVLHKLHKNVFMYYYFHGDRKLAINPYYLNYAVPYTKEIINAENNIIIMPETFLSPIFNKSYHKIQKVIWWLSVTNYTITLDEIEKASKTLLYNIKGIIRPDKHPAPPTIKKLIESKVENIAHSFFSFKFLEENKLPITGKMTDYMNNIFINTYQENVKREDQVIYNPKKNGAYLDKIIALLPDVKWKPIANMTPAEVAVLMNKSKLYIDFGYHPGQERMPREAILMGCCIITGTKGSAKYFEDVPLTDQFKFEDTDSNIPIIIDRIKACLNDYENQITLFDSYRNMILNEASSFENTVATIFETNCK